MASYGDLLRDPRWQRRRLEIMQRDDFTCMSCASTDKTLNVHHRYYLKNRKPWEYDDDCLVTLCEGCHKESTDEQELMMRSIRRLKDCEYDAVRGFTDVLIAFRPGSESTIQATSYNHAIGIGMAIGVDADGVLLLGRFDPKPYLNASRERDRQARRERLVAVDASAMERGS